MQTCHDRLLSLQCAACDELLDTIAASNPLQPHVIVARVQHLACDIRSLDAIVQERVREEFRVELRVVGWRIEDDVADASDFVAIPVEGVSST